LFGVTSTNSSSSINSKGNLFNFFVKQKKLALIFTVSVIAVGLLAFNNIQRDQFPAVDFECQTFLEKSPS
jgi:hypothetical protein